MLSYSQMTDPVMIPLKFATIRDWVVQFIADESASGQPSWQDFVELLTLASAPDSEPTESEVELASAALLLMNPGELAN